ncbi:MAG: TIGR04255 family protein [Candidatus Sulfotelmatobacter sp.]
MTNPPVPTKNTAARKALFNFMRLLEVPEGMETEPVPAKLSTASIMLCILVFDLSPFFQCPLCHRVLNISLSERIGLRYVNLIRLGPDENWVDFIHQGFLGLDPNSVGVEKWTSGSQFLGMTGVGQLVIRCSRSEQPFPPDLLTSTLAYSTPLSDKGETVTTLDFDHFAEQASDFKVPAAMATLERLHESLDRVFTAAVKHNNSF